MLLYYLLNSYQIYRYVLQLVKTYDIEIIVTTNFLFAPFAIRAAKRSCIPIVFDLVDFQPYHINYIGVLPAFLKRSGNLVLSTVLDYDIKQANHLITTGKPLYEYIKRKGEKDLTIISNGVEPAFFNSSFDPTLIRKKYNINAPVICFIGAMEYWVDYHYLFQGIHLLKEQYPKICCLVVGPSKHFGLGRIKQLAEADQVAENIIFTGEVAYHKLGFYICASDVCVLPFLRNYLTHCVIPMKLFEYLACERPVISVPLAGVQSIAKESIYYASTPEEFATITHNILSSKSTIKERLIQGKTLAENYQWEDLSRQYEDVLKQVLTNFASYKKRN